MNFFTLSGALMVVLVGSLEARPQGVAAPFVPTMITYSAGDAAKPKLNGLTLEMEPYVQLVAARKDGENPFKGYMVDALDEIVKDSPFGYTLKLDQAVGKATHNELLKQVKDKNIDFVLADMTITEERKADVDFTEPLLNITLAAIVRKADFESSKTLQALVEATSSDPAVKYSIVKGGATEAYLSKSMNPTAVKIWTKIQADKEASSLKNYKANFEKVRSGNFIFFGETPRADYINAVECDLKAVPDSDLALADYAGKKQAIVVKKGLAELADLNKAIKKITDDGTLEKLQMKYWKDMTACRNT